MYCCTPLFCLICFQLTVWQQLYYYGCVEPESLKFLLPHTQKISSLKRLGCKAVSSLMHIFIVMKLGSSLLEGSKRIYGQGLGQDK